MPPAIEAHGLSKRYRLGVSGTGWLVNDLSRWVRRMLVRAKGEPGAGGPDHIWALRDVSFEVKPGAVVGIVGNNGAGKSTLLKVLSRITRPTSGEAVVRGRVASLLEVGTGFHLELTGRENIFLNGAILGMTHAEIRRRFEEIVAFAGVERFVDTPVKRYSSGMYLRLAFAVAAHLDVEILLVDEVLAVGDVEFQRRCLDKIEGMGHEGRTVLFVSHNLGSLLSLCGEGLLLEGGEVTAQGKMSEVVDVYLARQRHVTSGFAYRHGFDPARQVIESVEILNTDFERTSTFNYGSTMHAVLSVPGAGDLEFGLEVRIRSSELELVAYASSWIHAGERSGVFKQPDRILVTIPRLDLVQDDYMLDFNLRIPHLYHVDAWWEAIGFTIVNCRPPGSPISLARSDHWGSTVWSDVTMRVLEKDELEGDRQSEPRASEGVPE